MSERAHLDCLLPPGEWSLGEVGTQRDCQCPIQQAFWHSLYYSYVFLGRAGSLQYARFSVVGGESYLAVVVISIAALQSTAQGAQAAFPRSRSAHSSGVVAHVWAAVWHVGPRSRD